MGVPVRRGTDGRTRMHRGTAEDTPRREAAADTVTLASSPQAHETVRFGGSPPPPAPPSGGFVVAAELTVQQATGST